MLLTTAYSSIPIFVQKPSKLSKIMSTKMKKIAGVCACLLILALDITAWVLAMKAMKAQQHAKHMRVWIFECKGRSHEAFVLGVAAAVLLGVAHILLNVLPFLNSNDSDKPRPSNKFSKPIFVCTWIIFLVGVILLVIGTRSNEKSKMSCGFTYHNFLSTGGIMCIVHAILSLAYYVTSAAAAALYTTST